ncbi:MAG: tRNA pseudouridine38-40 synthase [Pseudonocardiales bacterium]|nr:tRNA pseudouridine38-40 synthase [Pseudonocardiales bacterium]
MTDGAERRLRLDLGYDGTDFSGWAVQPGRRTVQGELERALSTLFRAELVRLTVAGRTDAGVHATGQVAHCDVPGAAWDQVADKALRKLNGLLDRDVRVYSLAPAAPGFDARFAATWRRYRYRISDAPYGADPLRRRDTVGWRRSLDAAAMHEAAQRLLGLHDFAGFCRRRESGTSIRTLQQLDVLRQGYDVDVLVQADAFCHSMVRSLVGALAAVGDGSRPLDWPASLLSLTARSDEITVAPAHGLTLTAVGYPPDEALAARAEQTRAIRTGLN